MKFEFSMVDKSTGRFVKHHPVYLFSTHARVNTIYSDLITRQDSKQTDKEQFYHCHYCYLSIIHGQHLVSYFSICCSEIQKYRNGIK